MSLPGGAASRRAAGIGRKNILSARFSTHAHPGRLPKDCCGSPRRCRRILCFCDGRHTTAVRKRIMKSDTLCGSTKNPQPTRVVGRGATCSKIEAGPGKTSLDPYGLLRSAANPGSVGYGRSDAFCFRPATFRCQSRSRFPSERRGAGRTPQMHAA